MISVYVDDIEIAGKKENIDPMWTVLMKHIDFGEFDHVHLGCTQRECKTDENIAEQFQKLV